MFATSDSWRGREKGREREIAVIKNHKKGREREGEM